MSIYDKRVSKVLEIAALAGVGLDHKSLAIKSHFIVYLLFDFLTVDRRWNWLRPLGGWHPIVIEQSSCSSDWISLGISKYLWWLAIRDCKCLSARLPGKLSHSCEDLLSISLHPTYPRLFGTVTDPRDHTSLMSLEKWMLSWCKCWFSDLNDCSKVLT